MSSESNKNQINLGNVYLDIFASFEKFSSTKWYAHSAHNTTSTDDFDKI